VTPPRVARREWGWVITAASTIMALTTVPYLLAAASQNADWRFGGFLLAVEDGNSYLAKMGEGAHGAWLFTLPYSTEPQRGALVYSFYLLLGHLAGPAHATQVLVYQAARLVCGLGLLLASYAFLAEFLPRVRQRRLALLLVALGGGLGWLLTLLFPGGLLGSLPIDLISPEAFSFLDLFAFPHLAAARALFLLALLAFWRGRGALAGLLLIGVGLVQPVPVLVMWAAVGAFLALSFFWRRAHGTLAAWARELRAAVILGLFSAPLVVYTVYELSSDPVLRQWSAQNQLPSPSAIHYLLAYGLWLAVAVPGWRVLWRRQPRLALLAGGWIALTPLLLYIPVSVQRRLIEGVELPLVALVVLGLTVALRRTRRWLAPVVVSLSLPTTALLFLGALLAARQPAEPIFHPADEVAAFGWLAENAAPGQAVLSAYATGNALPAYAPVLAYLGHGSETVSFASKAARVTAFYKAATPDAERQALLADGRIAFVIFGPHERAIGAFDPAEAAYLQPRAQTGDYSVYQVAP
jgi:hypothetical protein